MGAKMRFPEAEMRSPEAEMRSPEAERASSRVAWLVACVHIAVQLLLPLRPLIASRGDMLDAVHTKSHTLGSWRMMAVYVCV